MALSKIAETGESREGGALFAGVLEPALLALVPMAIRIAEGGVP